MPKKAKCKLCNTTIESAGRWDFVSCSCGEICVDCNTGEFHVHIKTDPVNLLLLDDEGNEIVPVKSSEPPNEEQIDSSVVHMSPKKEELLDMLDAMRKNIEEMPQNALFSPITHSDFGSLLMLLSALFRA
jgi:hypothetical protein